MPIVLALTIALLYVVLGGVVFLQRRESHEVRAFVALCVSTALLLGGITLLQSTRNILFDRILFVGGFGVIGSLYVLLHFFRYRARSLPVSVPWMMLIPLVVLLGTVPFGFIIRGVMVRDGLLVPVYGPGKWVFALAIVLYTAALFWQGCVALRDARGLLRLQLTYFAAAIGMLLMSIVACNVILPALGITAYNGVTAFVALVSLAITGYAIGRHALFSVRFVIHRFTALVLGIAVVGIVYVAGIGVATRFHVFSTNSIALIYLVPIVMLCGGALIVPYLTRYFRHATEHWMLPDRYDMGEAMTALSRMLHEGMDGVVRGDNVAVLLGTYLQTTVTWCTDVADYAVRNTDHTYDVAYDDVWYGTLLVVSRYDGTRLEERDWRLVRFVVRELGLVCAYAAARNELTTHATTLERRVVERTATIAAQQTYEQQLVREVAHGLQTPLTIVRLHLDSLRSISDASRSATLLKTLDTAFADLSQVAYDLVAYARLARPIEQVMQPVRIDHLLADLCEYVAVIAAADDVVLQYDSPLYPCWVRGDVSHLRRLFENVLSNAVRAAAHTSRTDRRVIVAVTVEDDAVVVTVRDTGDGLGEDDLVHLFEPFYRGARGGSMGLGLAIVRRIADMHGASITAANHPDGGAVLTIHLPYASVDSAQS